MDLSNYTLMSENCPMRIVDPDSGRRELRGGPDSYQTRTSSKVTMFNVYTRNGSSPTEYLFKAGDSYLSALTNNSILRTSGPTFLNADGTYGYHVRIVDFAGGKTFAFVDRTDSSKMRYIGWSPMAGNYGHTISPKFTLQDIDLVDGVYSPASGYSTNEYSMYVNMETLPMKVLGKCGAIEGYGGVDNVPDTTLNSCATLCAEDVTCDYAMYDSGTCTKYSGGTALDCSRDYTSENGQYFGMEQQRYNTIPNAVCDNEPYGAASGVDNIVACRNICNPDSDCRFIQYDSELKTCAVYSDCTEKSDRTKRYALQKVSDMAYFNKLKSRNDTAQESLQTNTASLQELSSQLETQSNALVGLSAEITELTAKLKGRTDVASSLSQLQSDISIMEMNLAKAQELNRIRADLIKKKEAIIADKTLTVKQKDAALEETLSLIKTNNTQIEQSVASIAASRAKIEEQKAKLEEVEAEMEETKESVGIIPAIMDFLDSIADAFGIEM